MKKYIYFDNIKKSWMRFWIRVKYKIYIQFWWKISKRALDTPIKIILKGQIKVCQILKVFPLPSRIVPSFSLWAIFPLTCLGNYRPLWQFNRNELCTKMTSSNRMLMVGEQTNKFSPFVAFSVSFWTNYIWLVLDNVFQGCHQRPVDFLPLFLAGGVGLHPHPHKCKEP